MINGTESKICQNCKASFVIDAQDFAFYEKMQVLAPTFCPACRFQRRLAFFNLMRLYKRPCDLCRKDSISIYSPESPYVVYCPRCWWSDNWDPLSYGREYDFSRSFFEQWNELARAVPHLGLAIELNCIDTSPYTNYGGSLKNCHLLFNADFNEYCQNGHYVWHNAHLLDTSLALKCEWCYDCMHIFKVNSGVGLRNQVTESLRCMFLRDSDNCQECIASANLRNKKYYIFNEPHTKEEYEKRKKRWDTGSYAAYQALKKEAHTHWDSLPHKTHYDEMSQNCTGNLVFQSKNCRDSFELAYCQDGRYLQMLQTSRDCYDVTLWTGVEKGYDCLAVGSQAQNIRFSALAALGAHDMEYSFLTISGTGFFGCIGIKKANYCILNKEYSKEEFAVLRGKIIAQMREMPYRDSGGRVYRYGEFFPPELSPFAYNETLANYMFPLDRESAKNAGYAWREEEPRAYTISVPADELPDHIKDAGDSLLGETIGCSQCQRGFKLTHQELEFLRRMNMPLPRICPFCRIEEKMRAWFDEFRLVASACSRCGRAINIPKHLENKQIVYCKQCYLAEVV